VGFSDIRGAASAWFNAVAIRLLHAWELRAAFERRADAHPKDATSQNNLTLILDGLREMVCSVVRRYWYAERGPQTMFTTAQNARQVFVDSDYAICGEASPVTLR
jgi:hypothetical protein